MSDQEFLTEEQHDVHEDWDLPKPRRLLRTATSTPHRVTGIEVNSSNLPQWQPRSAIYLQKCEHICKERHRVMIAILCYKT